MSQYLEETADTLVFMMQKTRRVLLPPPNSPRPSKKIHPKRTVNFSPTVADRTRIRGILSLFLLGTLLIILYIALYPLLAMRQPLSIDFVQQWFHWHMALPTQWFSAVPWLQPTQTAGSANLLLLLLSLSLLISFLAALIGRSLIRQPLSPLNITLIFWLIFIFATLFALTMLLLPISSNTISQDMLLSAFYGRMAVNYHTNPYVVAPTTFPHDTLQSLLSPIKSPYIPALLPGPVWIDLSILVTLAANNSIPDLFIDYRLLGIFAHLSNIILLWVILTKIRPQLRISATLLYAWNPLVLVFEISQMHTEVVLILFLLLAILFFQRDALLLSWVFLLLAILINLSCLLLLPLFFRIIARKTRFMWWGRRFLWWVWLLIISGIVAILAYIPYWQGWGIAGLTSSVLQVFWQQNALNSLDAAILKLPITLSPTLLWVFTPDHWSIFLLIVLALFLFFSFWLVDTVELVLLCGSALLLLLLILQPLYLPWHSTLPLALALCSTYRSVITLALLLLAGTLLSYYFWLLPSTWSGQGLAVIGIPCLLWGWSQFFASIRQEKDTFQRESGPLHLVRPPWLSRPWPTHPGRRR